jgi:hypothetical protein
VDCSNVSLEHAFLKMWVPTSGSHVFGQCNDGKLDATTPEDGRHWQRVVMIRAGIKVPLSLSGGVLTQW